MKQAVRPRATNTTPAKPSKPKKKTSGGSHRHRNHPKYGTSKLEEKFAREFLNKLGVRYDYQFEAKDIGRFYDFYLPDYKLLIEVDGVYWHSKGLLREEMSPMQKHNRRVDLYKNAWAHEHRYILLRFWEDDINNNPAKVMSELKAALGMADERKALEEDRKRRH